LEKPAATEHEIHPLLARRWSPRAFGERDVRDLELASLFEAARWAPSSFNEQPWHFLVARRRDAEEHERMVACLSEGNRGWAAKAPVLMISVASLRFASGDKPNRHAFHDVGLATASLMLQATSIGLVTHAMAGFDVEKTRLVYRIPAAYEPVAAIAAGWPGEPDALPPNLRERELVPRTRRALDEFVFGGIWGRRIGLGVARD
jgi:nitroreductase